MILYLNSNCKANTFLFSKLKKKFFPTTNKVDKNKRKFISQPSKKVTFNLKM